MSIVTKTGDKGTTGLFGGERIAKDDPRIHAYGTVDELNAVLGLILSQIEPIPKDISASLSQLQNLLFRLGADLATPLTKKGKVERMSDAHVQSVEGWIEKLESSLPQQKAFLLPGGSPSAALLHLARTICRRAERWTVTLAKMEEINPQAIIFLNRLSDYLFLAARAVNQATGKGETEVSYAE